MARDGEIIQRQHFLSSPRHILPSKVRLRSDQTPRNVYIMDATIMRCFQAELFSRFQPPSYAGHVNLAGEKPRLFMLNCKYGSPVEIIVSRVQYFFSA